MNENTTLGHYTILRPLGKGGMGEVYLAEDTRLRREVAIKILPERLRNDPERLKRFRREAEAAASLKHPNIATIHALEEFDGQMFITMEYVDGKSLKDVIPDGGMDIGDPNTVGRTQGSSLHFFDVFLPLADALSHAHNQGRIHRDLKPGNIMIASDGTPKILDFGLARIIESGDVIPGYSESETPPGIGPDDKTRTMDEEEQRRAAEAAEAAKKGLQSLTRGGQLIGTPQYMSPEQAEREETDARTDLFSFGVVMYEALTGVRPFEGKTLESIIGRIVEAEPKAVTEIKPVTPYTLWRTIRGCLEKERSQRIQTAKRLHKELSNVQDEVISGTTLIDASTYSTLHTPHSALKRQPVGVAIMALIVAFVSVTATRLLTPEPPEPSLRKFQWPVKDFTMRGRGDGGGPVISPDGTMIAYVADNRLWIRELNSTSSREIPDSEGAFYPFWSPGSDQVGYITQREYLYHPTGVTQGSRTWGKQSGAV